MSRRARRRWQRSLSPGGGRARAPARKPGADHQHARQPKHPTDANCNIRVDLVFFIPILLTATFCAYQSYMGRPGQEKVVGTVLGVIGLVVFALLVESFGYTALSGVAIAGALAIGVVRRRTPPP